MNSSHDDTAFDYCVNKAIPDGSNLYYATIFETKENKTLIISMHAFLYELGEIIQECSDPGVARIKLQWWQEEIERLYTQQARHPVTRQMQECLDINENVKSTFKSVIEFFNHFIFIEQTDTLDTILALYKSTTGEIWYQCGKQLHYDDEETLKLLLEMGALLRYVVCLQQPHTYINDSRCIIPSNYIKNEELMKLRSEAVDKQHSQKEAFSPLINELAKRLDKTYIKLKEKELPKLKHTLILNRIAIKTCHEILADGSNLLDKNISLTPLRKLWIAWRTNTFS